MIIRTFHNNPHLLIAGTDQPQRDGDGNPIPDPLFGTTTEEERADPETFPVDLSATAFNEHVWVQLGGTPTGMARFQAIIDAAEAAGGACRAVATQYNKSLTFSKQKVANFTALLIWQEIMTEDEADAILDHWPEV